MKSFRSALVLTVCLALASAGPALAGSHSGTSPSFKSGFSSQKSNSVHSQPAPPPASRASGPGAFGKAAPASAQQPRNTSAMSRDIDQSAASGNALKTLDERRAAAAATTTAAATGAAAAASGAAARSADAAAFTGTAAVGAARPQPPYAPLPPGYQTVPQPNNTLMHGLFGFMLGRAMSQNHQPVAYPAAQGQPAPVASSPDAVVTGMPGLNAPAPAPAPQPSFGHSVLRWLVGLTVLSVMLWALVYAVRKLRRLRAAPNYSFERN